MRRIAAPNSSVPWRSLNRVARARSSKARCTARSPFRRAGNKGFGYDPIFVADGMDQTFGEIDPAQKHAMSHRARAFAKLTAALKTAT